MIIKKIKYLLFLSFLNLTNAAQYDIIASSNNENAKQEIETFYGECIKYSLNKKYSLLKTSQKGLEKRNTPNTGYTVNEGKSLLFEIKWTEAGCKILIKNIGDTDIEFKGTILPLQLGQKFHVSKGDLHMSLGSTTWRGAPINNPAASSGVFRIT